MIPKNILSFYSIYCSMNGIYTDTVRTYVHVRFKNAQVESSYPPLNGFV